MRTKPIAMVALALVFGGAAMLSGQKWLDRQASLRQGAPTAPEPAVRTQTIVVAAQPFTFGTELLKQHLREIAWPADALPKGAFKTVDEVLDGKTRRVALAAVEENEPLLALKVTGPGQRASLAAVIEEGLRAVTVRVNDVNGVAGFVLPGERVDVLLTRNLDKDEAYADVLLQNVRVLAVDQIADERSDKPAVVKAVTVEVSTAQAQKLSLAASIGTLSLTLRAAGLAEVENPQRVSVANLFKDEPSAPTPVVVAAAPAADVRRTTSVSVTRAMKRQEYSVPVLSVIEDDQLGTASTTGPRTTVRARPTTTAPNLPDRAPAAAGLTASAAAPSSN